MLTCPQGTRYVQGRGPILGIIGAVCFVVGVVMAMLPASYATGNLALIFLVFAFLSLMMLSCTCGWCGHKIDVHNYGDAKYLPIDVPNGLPVILPGPIMAPSYTSNAGLWC